MAVSSYGYSTESSGVVRIIKDLETDVRGRHVVLVEDIIDSGLTTGYLAELLRARGPASFEICALLVREDARSDGIRYVGFSVPADWAGRVRAGRGRALPRAVVGFISSMWTPHERHGEPLMTSKWSDGIEPRGFRWIIAERFRRVRAARRLRSRASARAGASRRSSGCGETRSA